MALISTFVNPNAVISENINDAFKTVELVADNLDLITTVATEIEAGQLPPGTYSSAYLDANFALIANTYTVGQADDKFATQVNFNSTGINDDASTNIFTLTNAHNFIMGEGAFPTSWDNGSFAVQFAPFGAIYSYQGTIEESHFNLTNNVHTYGVVEQRMDKGEASSYRQYRGHHYFRSAQAATPEVATALIQGKEYIIESVGTTDFTLVGASSNIVGEKFFATGAGTGTGTASQTQITWTNGITILNTGRVTIPLLNFTDTVALFDSTDLNAAVNETFLILQDPAIVYPSGSSGASLIGVEDVQNNYVADTVEGALKEIWDRLTSDGNDANWLGVSGSDRVGIEQNAANYWYQNGAFTVEQALRDIYTTYKSNVNAKGASLIGIEDFKDEIDATTVEGALAELVHHSFAHTYKKINISTPITEDDHGAIIHVEGGTGITLSLPAISAVDDGFFFILDIKESEGAVTLSPSLGDEIDESPGDTDYSSGDYVLFQSNGTEWETSLNGNAFGTKFKLGRSLGSLDIVGNTLTFPAEGALFTYAAPTGNTINTITKYGNGTGRILLRCETSFTLEFNPVFLITPGGADISVSSGDFIEFIQYGGDLAAGYWYVSNYTPFVDPAQSNAGHVVQIDEFSYSDYATGTNRISVDNTIPPQSGNVNEKGWQVMSRVHSPKKMGNKVIIEAVINVSASTPCYVTGALFKGNTTAAIAAAVVTVDQLNYMRQIHLFAESTVDTLSPTPYNIRIGSDVAATTSFNGNNSGALFGGRMASYMKITEVEV